MNTKATFTGRARRRTTHPWVKAGDGLARLLITLGGIGTIVAVLLVGVFLLVVALPLFRSATIAFEHVAPLGHDPQRLCSLGTDENGNVGWLLDVAKPDVAKPDDAKPADAEAGSAPAGMSGRIRLFNLADGAALLDRTVDHALLHLVFNWRLWMRSDLKVPRAWPSAAAPLRPQSVQPTQLPPLWPRCRHAGSTQALEPPQGFSARSEFRTD